eukprot:365151-Chlamydomonas_euryale.AAC.19
MPGRHRQRAVDTAAWRLTIGGGEPASEAAAFQQTRLVAALDPVDPVQVSALNIKDAPAGMCASGGVNDGVVECCGVLRRAGGRPWSGIRSSSTPGSCSVAGRVRRAE